MAPANDVLSIPELLENILLRLPNRDLLLSQRMSHSFKNVVAGSMHLQRKLFFIPVRAAETINPDDVESNELLRTLFATKWIEEELEHPRLHSSTGLWSAEFVEFPGDAGSPCIYVLFEEVQEHRTGVPTKPARNVEPSWKKMYLSRPIYLTAAVFDLRRSLSIDCWITEPTTMGEILAYSSRQKRTADGIGYSVVDRKSGLKWRSPRGFVPRFA